MITLKHVSVFLLFLGLVVCERSTVFRWPAPHSTRRYVKLFPYTPAMFAMTACVRMKTAFAKDESFILSYATLNDKNSFLMGYNDGGSIVVFLGNTKITMRVPSSQIFDGAWHHWCFSWNSRGGKWNLFKDGVSVTSGTGYQTDRIIPGDGVWIVGQDQDTLGGGFSAEQAYVGDATSINVWSTDNVDVNAAARCDERMGGDVISWDIVTKESHEVSTYKEDLCGNTYCRK